MLRLPHRLVALVAASTLAIGGCGDSSADEDPAESTTTIPVVSEVGRRRPWDGMVLPPDAQRGYQAAATTAELAELVEIGAPNVAVVVPLVQDDTAGVPRRHPGATPTDTALGQLMEAAGELELGLVVELRVEVAGDPDAEPQPTDRADWFHHYGRLARHFAGLAEQYRASLLVIGGVPGALAADGDAWTAVVADLRQHYAGPVAFTIDAADVERVTFWDAVEVIGIAVPDPPEADVPEPVAADLEKAWEPMLAEVTSLAESWSRPVVLTRVGFPGIGRDTADASEVEIDEQLSAYEALFTVTNQTPAIEGVLVCCWSGGPTGAHHAAGSFSPEDRPAEQVLRRAWKTPLADEGGATGTEATEAGTGSGAGARPRSGGG